MKYIFLGSPRFSKIVLEKMLEHGLSPAALVCNPDRPVGRKHIITAPETKQLVLSGERRAESGEEIKIFQPEKLSALSSELSALAPDLFIVAAYAKIIPQSILDIPKLGTIGVHPSLLPKYRGASPIQSALLSGEEKTGVTLYLLGAGVDDGPILAQSGERIAENDDYKTLEEKLAHRGGEMLAAIIPRFVNDEVKPVPQDATGATLTKKFTSEDGFIEEADLHAARTGNEKLARAIHNKIRALGAEPGAWTLRNGKRLKLLRSELKDGKLVLHEIQWESKKPERL